ncbi:hypothetical protein GCM10007391_20770 [Alteromonas halophila]|uniref:Uncharacterized protein n=1 Tax=Alteromonas halophila TaxID=516698 RepID=A0A918MZE0_9ALTE|nr:hypothetical protein GCM10007391_20770 [Alteromonas halophila]
MPEYERRASMDQDCKKELQQRHIWRHPDREGANKSIAAQANSQVPGQGGLLQA